MPRLKSQMRNERGAVELIVAAGMLLFLILAALVIDIGNADQTGRSLQNAADAGALSGTQELNSVSPTNVAFAADYALDTLKQPHVAATGCGGAPTGEAPGGSTTCFTSSANGVINGWVYVTTPVSPPLQPYGCAGTCVQGSQEITVKACQTVNTTFARVINVTSERLCKSATGERGSVTAPLALFAKGPSPPCTGSGLTWNNSGDTVTGVVWSDTSFTMNGSNNTLGPTFYNSACSPGFTQTGTNDTYNGQSTPIGVSPIPDPCLSAQPQCDTSVYPGSCTDSSLPANNIPITNHVYCISANSNQNIQVDGFNGNVTFIVTGGAKLNFSCSNGSTCNVSPAPTGGGFVVWNNSPGGSCGTDLVTANNPGQLILNGTIYVPNGGVRLNLATTGTSNAFIDSCTMNINGDLNANGPGVSIPSSTSNLIR